MQVSRVTQTGPGLYVELNVPSGTAACGPR
jgi:hypothetical protein